MNKLSIEGCATQLAQREPEVFAELQSLRSAVHRIDSIAKNLSDRLQSVVRMSTPTAGEIQKSQHIETLLAREINTIKQVAIEAEQTLEDIISRLEI